MLAYQTNWPTSRRHSPEGAARHVGELFVLKHAEYRRRPRSPEQVAKRKEASKRQKYAKLERESMARTGRAYVGRAVVAGAGDAQGSAPQVVQDAQNDRGGRLL